AGLPTLVENAELTTGSLQHSEYMARNDNGIARTEKADNPFFTEAGRQAALNGNIYATTDVQANYLWAMNFWMSAPFHAVQVLNPHLESVGYGNFRDDLGGVRVAAVLDVGSGVVDEGENTATSASLSADVSYPITFPADGGETWILQQSLLEYPEPLTSCDGYHKPVGPPLIVQVGNGNITPRVTDFALWHGGYQLEVCVFDETSYVHPDANAQERGRSILGAQDAIVMIPKLPLAVGGAYTAQVVVNGEVVEWSFTAVSPPPIQVEPLESAEFVNWYVWRAVGLEWGGQTHDFTNPLLMRNMGMSWVKIQQKWRPDSNPNELVERIELAHAFGFKVLLSLTGDPYPNTIDFDAYVAFLQGVAALDPPPDAIEVWNEMNIDFEWPAGEISPQQYVDGMLKPAYQAIKQTNASIVVISGAPAPTGFDDGTHAWASSRYVNGLADAGAANYLDCVGVHYNEGATSPFDTTGHPAGEYFGWYMQPSLNSVFLAFHGTRPLCITELGILSGGGFRSLPARFWWAQDTSVDEQARWLAEALTVANQSGYVRLAIVFNVDMTHWGDDPQAGFAIIRPAGNCPFCELILGGGE
ncbi:MAG: CAP domain-containing protein, partial [Chloroflexi bacterium]